MGCVVVVASRRARTMSATMLPASYAPLVGVKMILAPVFFVGMLNVRSRNARVLCPYAVFGSRAMSN
jgi:hypothetical protein